MAAPGRAPSSLGYALPAEWDEHVATWIAWPHNRTDWPGKLTTIPWVYGEVVRHLAPHERVRILVDGAAREAGARRVLGRVGAPLDAIDFHRVPTDRVWTRDSGALIVSDRTGRRCATLWRFNAWAKYPDWKKDARVGAAMARLLDLPSWQAASGGRPVALEGGAIDVDGAGTLLATEECLLSEVQERNPGLGREGTESALAAGLGIRKVLWLGRGIAGDDTHGHVDDVCRFVAPGRVVLCSEPDGRDPNHAILEENRERLEDARDATGGTLEVVRLPMPRPLFFDGRRLPASYANFYVANGVVLVPTFNDPTDRVALGALAELFPGREVVGVHAVDLVWGLGTLHCMTCQEPASR
ncbi:MAG: agmatine deiminase family protein [Deltaproteobacteria bacterium]|nr:agmatine deiminase family protein [Deltaproteobacteria bacterium]